MARAGVTYTVGREANAVYVETWDGYHVSTHHQFSVPVDPYRTPGDPASGLLPGISAAAPGTTGAGDRRIQAYDFRLCLTRAVDRLPFPRPPGYDPARYELMLRYLQAGVWDVFGTTSRCRMARATSTTTAPSPPTTSAVPTAGPRATTTSGSASSKITSRTSRGCCTSSRTTRACRRTSAAR